MNKFAVLIIFFFVAICFTCKKKATIRVQVINPALNEKVANATITLVEKRGEAGGGLFNGKAECEELATAITDFNGECFFDKEKLRKNSNYKYFCAVTESWGIKQPYTCGGRTSNFLAKENNQEIILSDEQSGFLEIQLENLLNPSKEGDSLITNIDFLEFFDPVFNTVKGGGRIYTSWPFHGANGYPFANNIIIPAMKAPGGKYSVHIIKRKLGHREIIKDTIKVYPNRTKRYTITW